MASSRYGMARFDPLPMSLIIFAGGANQPEPCPANPNTTDRAKEPLPSFRFSEIFFKPAAHALEGS